MNKLKKIVCGTLLSSLMLLTACGNNSSTDRELASCLIYGGDYIEKDGFASDKNGNILKDYDVIKSVFGFQENVLRCDDGLSQFASAEEMIKYFDENTVRSKAIGLSLDSVTPEIRELLNEFAVLWKSADLEKDLADLRQQLNDAGIQSVVDEMNKKIGEQN